MTTPDAARLRQAFSLLQQSRSQEAHVLATELAERSPHSPDALHLLALCRRNLGDVEGALTAFETARAQAPRDAHIVGNYANFLRRIGRLTDAIRLYREALAVAPGHADSWINLGLALIEAADHRAACDALERALRTRAQSSTAWQALGVARRGLGDLEGAEQALRQATACDPRNGAAWINLGVVRRLLGDPTESLACYARARESGFTGAQLDDAEASAHLDLGDPASALALARRLTRAAADYVPGHTLLAHVLWEHGESLAPAEEPLAAFRAAVAAQPAHTPLRLAFLRFLIESGRAGEALEQVKILRRGSDTPALMGTEAHVLEMLGDPVAAGRLFAAACEAAAPAEAGLLNLYVRHLLKAGQPELAAQRALEALQREDGNQPALAYLGLAWRLLGDPRERWLCDYDDLIAETSLEVPSGFADEQAFLRALATSLLPLHTARREPVDQSLRGGSQTSGVLFGRRDAVIVALRDALAGAVRGWLARLPDDAAHPFLRRKSSRTRFSGSWSARLRSAGRHINHFHQQGWLSSAFYVALPPTVAQPPAGSTAGFLQFGAPPEELGLGLGPRRVLRPREGRLVLFPSYFWHGTLPFHDEQPRLTVAFDAVPA